MWNSQGTILKWNGLEDWNEVLHVGCSQKKTLAPAVMASLPQKYNQIIGGRQGREEENHEKSQNQTYLHLTN